MLNFFKDSEPAYTQEELEGYKNKRVTYNGEEMTEYEASQRQRAMERRVRKTKRELAGYDAGIQAASDDSLKAELQSAFDRKSVLLKKQEARLKDFTNQTGLMRDRAREQVPAHFDTAQGKTVAFNKSVSQKAVSVNQRNQKFIAELNDVGIKTKGFDFYAGDTQVLNELKSTYIQLAKEYPDEIKNITIRYGFDKDKSIGGWYDKEKGEIVFNKNVFDCSLSLMKDYEKYVKNNHFPKGTDYRAYFYHEFGHHYSYFHNIDNKKIVEQMTKEYFNGYYTRKKADEMLSQKLSIYATEETRPKYQEVIAECFSEWYNSKKPRKFCEEYLRKAGVIK